MITLFDNIICKLIYNQKKYKKLSIFKATKLKHW